MSATAALFERALRAVGADVAVDVVAVGAEELGPVLHAAGLADRAALGDEGHRAEGGGGGVDEARAVVDDDPLSGAACHGAVCLRPRRWARDSGLGPPSPARRVGAGRARGGADRVRCLRLKRARDTCATRDAEKCRARGATRSTQAAMKLCLLEPRGIAGHWFRRAIPRIGRISPRRVRNPSAVCARHTACCEWQAPAWLVANRRWLALSCPKILPSLS
jgi:hypothetical protein